MDFRAADCMYVLMYVYDLQLIRRCESRNAYFRQVRDRPQQSSSKRQRHLLQWLWSPLPSEMWLLGATGRSNQDTRKLRCASDVVATVLFGCRSKQNLAARLAAKIFTVEERQSSNCRGVLGKTPLDVFCVKGIYTVCMHHLPLQRLETKVMADKEMRTAIDKVCRKTKHLPTLEKFQGSSVWLFVVFFLYVPVCMYVFHSEGIAMFHIYKMYELISFIQPIASPQIFSLTIIKF